MRCRFTMPYEKVMERKELTGGWYNRPLTHSSQVEKMKNNSRNKKATTNNVISIVGHTPELLTDTLLLEKLLLKETLELLESGT